MYKIKHTLLILGVILFLPIILIWVSLTGGFDNEYDKMRERIDNEDSDTE